MTEQTKTFSFRLTSNYVPNTVIEIAHFRDIALDVDETAAIYLEEVSLVLQLKNLKLGIFPDYDGDETETEKVMKFNASEERSERFGLQFLSRKNNIGDWDEDVEIICINRGRKDYISILQPFFTKYQVKILDIKDSYAIKLIDYGYGLIKLTDTIKISIGVKIEISKKNDISIFEARLAALELALQDRLINLPPNTLLGRDLNTGTVQQIPQTRFITPALLNQTIIDLVGGAPGALNTLVELAGALNNDANFATTVTNLIASKVGLTGNETVAGNKTFSGFTNLGNAGIKIQVLNFISPTTAGNVLLLAGQLPAVDKIISLTGWLRNVDTDFYPPSFYSSSKGYTNWWAIYSWSTNLYINLHPDSIVKMGNQIGTITVIYIN